MASPSPINRTLNGTSTPPANTTSSPQASNPTPATLTADAPTSQPTSQPSVPVPPTSTTDTGLSKRPRDARLIHLVLAAQGVTAYQERVPLQLLDFAYRYTSGVLSDALAVSAEAAPTMRGGNTHGVGVAQEGSVSLAAVRLAIASRLNAQFGGQLPREFMNEIAAERNRIALPRVEREFGVRLPDEKYCFTGVGWGLKEEWDSEVEEEEGDGGVGGMDTVMRDDADEGGGGEDEEFEDVMGVGDGVDREMADA
ncbi:Transcription initiation factor TFIID subunit 9 [Coniosporium apollinis]|uniref:Transcription initiation factor TFIID subunit 9 n=1 Tax=Coniosporium apollinis TaxID=61459 RepID=A0ABQ9P7I7_9PEZI|nr:Transcription initiation factor TFIID subunit 9 [Coniosporium apollinis]